MRIILCGSPVSEELTKSELASADPEIFHVPRIEVIDGLCDQYKTQLSKLHSSLPQARAHLDRPAILIKQIKELITLSRLITSQTTLLLNSGLELQDETRKIQEKRRTTYQKLQHLTPTAFFIQHIVNLPTARTIAEISFGCGVYFALANENTTPENIDILVQLWDRHLELLYELYALAQVETHAKAATESWTMTEIDFCLFYLCTISGDLSSTTYGMTSFILQAIVNLWTRATTKIELPTEAELITIFKLPLLAHLLTNQPSLTVAIASLEDKNTELKRKIDTLRIRTNWHGTAKGLLDWLAPTPTSSSLLKTLGIFSIRTSATKVISVTGNFLLQKIATKFFTMPDLIELESSPNPGK